MRGDKAGVIESWRGLSSSSGKDGEEGRGSNLDNDGEEGRQSRGGRDGKGVEGSSSGRVWRMGGVEQG